MKNPTETWNNLRRHCRREWKLAFFSTFLLGLLIHMPIMLRDIPNHDGLASMYFDQNMITSGRWFLTVACGISSYYTLPWLIGLLAMLYLGIAAVLLVEFLEVRQGWAAVLVGGLLAVFPSLASTFAYVFTMDGYMLAVLLAVMVGITAYLWSNGGFVVIRLGEYDPSDWENLPPNHVIYDYDNEYDSEYSTIGGVLLEAVKSYFSTLFCGDESDVPSGHGG